MDSRTEAQLLAAWREGDTAAGARLMTQSMPVLRRFFDKRAPQDTEDLVQQTLLSCLQAKDSVCEATSYRAYLLRIARNRWIDLQRSRGRSRVNVGTVPSVADPATTPSQRVGRAELNAAVVECLEELPEDQRAALELHYWDNLRLEELAEVLEVPVGTAKSRLRLARERLDRHLRARFGYVPVDLLPPA